MTKISLFLLLFSVQASAQKIVTVVGNGTSGYGGDNGPALSAMIAPYSFTLDKYGNIYIADNENYRVRKVNTAGIITTIAGTGISGHTGDGGPATVATIGPAVGVLADSVGNIFFTEWTYNTVRRISTSGIITTIAGNGSVGFSGDGGPATAAQFAGASSILMDKKGNIYVTDLVNNHIRKISTTGIITSIAGTGVGIAGGYSGDGGPATAANLKYPIFSAWGPNGDLYFCQWPHAVVRKIDTFGIITTVAGNGISGYSGDNGPATNAQLRHPHGIAVDSVGNMFIAEFESHVIRRVDVLTGIITTIAGTGVAGYGGDGGPASAAKLYMPNYLALDRQGNLYVNDVGNFRIRRITYNPVSVGEIGWPDAPVIFPNPVQGLLHITDLTGITPYTLRNVSGTTVAQGAVSPAANAIDISSLPDGVYLLDLSESSGKRTTSRVIKTK